MTLVRCDRLSIEFGDQPLLVDASLGIEENERICLIGRNGAGKTTLLRLISGDLEPDKGEIQYRQHLRISQLRQTLPQAREQSVEQVIKTGLAEQQRRIERFHALSADNASATEQHLRELEALQAEIEAGGGWQVDQQVDTVISQLELPAGKCLSELSGGWRRRVALGQALVSNPDLLLLDEPTNHLDINTIEWLEHRIRGYPGSVVFITHDRNFLQKLATRVVDIDRCKLTSWPGNYRNYLRLKEQADREEQVSNALFDKKLAQEEAWIRQGIKARRTRNEGRVRALQAMRDEREKRIKKPGKARVYVEAAEQSGRKVIEARNISHGYRGETLIRDFNLKVMRGDRIALIGNNGVGKSTLLKILLKQIEPDRGSVKLGTNLEIGYFDQVRRELLPDKSVAYNVSGGKDYISLAGRDRHIIGYLKNFLFSPKRSKSKVRELSGGECNRVLLAKLFARPTNLLVLDEPTNDLDVEMLEVLEERLVQYGGTLIVVSHDRQFIDNVVTSTLVFEADGKVQEYVGGYTDWLRQGRDLRIADELEKQAAVKAERPRVQNAGATGKLSYKYQRELDLLPGHIDQLENEIETLQQEIGQPAFYRQPFSQTQPVLDSLKEKQQALDEATARWLELEDMKSSNG